MPEQITKYPDVTLQVLRESGAVCGQGAPQNILKTCQQCHPNATEGFTQYDPHADKHDAARNPALYYASQFMTWLLLGVFGFFGLHAALWFPRGLAERRRWAREEHDDSAGGETDSSAGGDG